MNIPGALEICKGIGLVTPLATVGCMVGVVVVQHVATKLATKQAESWWQKLKKKIWGSK